MEYEWEPAKAAANLKKHGVRFSDAALSLEDPLGLTTPDPDASGEPRFVCLGADPSGRILVTVFTRGAALPGSYPRAKRARRNVALMRLRDEKGIRLF